MSELIIDKKIYGTRPDKNNRLDKEMRCYDLLDMLNVKFSRLDHKPTASIENCLEVEKVLGIEICKNLFLCNQQKTKFYLLMMIGSKKFITKNISKQIGSSRLSFASEEYMEKYLDITPGSVSVLGLMNDKGHNVNLIVDSDILKNQYIGMHPCINTSSLKIKTKDIFNIIIPYLGYEPIFVDIEN